MPANPSPAAPVLLLASGNEKKRVELGRMLEGLGCRLESLQRHPDVPEAVEDGRTFAENARSKALHYAGHTGLPCIADDSGLEVDALDGRPGVHSARYAGPGADDAGNRTKLLAELQGVPQEARGARFRCAVAVAEPGKILFECHGVTEGRITEQERGTGGFGYDPLFFSPELGCTFAECAAADKDAVSHRGRALTQLLPFLCQRFPSP